MNGWNESNAKRLYGKGPGCDTAQDTTSPGTRSGLAEIWGSPPPGLEVVKLGRLLLQVGAKIRMRDADQLAGALADRLAVQVCHTVLRHHITDMVAGGHDAGSLLEHGSNAGNAGPVAQQGR